jgi:putative hydrolase of the HAD superfamily
MSVIDAVVFDLGNVLLNFDWDIAADRLCARTGRTRRELDDYVVTTPFVTQLGLGQLSMQRFYEIVSRDLGFDGGYDEFARMWSEIFSPNEPMIEMAMALKGRVRQFILSNTNQIHVDYINRVYPFIHEFDGSVFSHEAGLMKPDPRIYSLALQKFGLVPEHTVFVDDIVANVDSARALGIHAIHYESVEQVRRELTKLGVAPI